MGSKSKSNQSSSSQNVQNSQGVNAGVGMNYGLNQSGNFGFNQGSSGSSNQSASSGSSSSSQDVWGQQSPFLQDVYGGAQDAFTNSQGQMQGLQPQVQDQLGGALQQAQGGYGDQLGGGFAAGLQGQVGPNAYVNPLANDMMSDAAKIKAQNLGALDARAAASGMSGSSGYRNQVADMQDNVDEQTMQGLNQLRFNAQNQGVANQMNLAGMMDQNQQSGLGNLQNIQQGAMNQFNPAMMGQQSAAMYGQTIGGPTVLGNSSSMNQSSASGSSSSNNSGMNTGFSNGMNMGMNMNGGTNIGNSFGSSTGQGNSSSTTLDPGFAAAGIGAMSDARLKENIQHVEQIDGVNMYTWDWKDEAMSSPMTYGVIAQEVSETHPEAVMTGDHGYMMVDYSKLGRAGEVALARMEG
jgi:hypothetical protein